jgi:hypothetical protein
VALDSGKELVVPIAKRSTHVMNHPGALSLVPAFGLESNAIGDKHSRYGLPFHNVVREFCEEFFGLDDLIDIKRAGRRDPDWFFRSDPAVALVREANAGRMSLYRLGMSIGPSDGSLYVIFLAHFHDASFFRWLETELVMNWESDIQGDTDAPVEFMPLFDARLE